MMTTWQEINDRAHEAFRDAEKAVRLAQHLCDARLQVARLAVGEGECDYRHMEV